MGANYFGIDLPNGTYYAGLVNDDGALTLYALGVNRSTIDVIPLDRGGVIDTALYLFAVSDGVRPELQQSQRDCTYYDYQIDIVAGKGEMSAVLHSVGCGEL